MSERANERSSFINKRIHLKTNFKYKYQNTLLGIRNNKMKINELILEQEQLDELNLKGLGTSVGKTAGSIAGGAVQGAQNFWNGAKQGYTDTRNAMKPDGTTQPTTPNTPSLSQGIGNVINAARGNTAPPQTPAQATNTQATNTQAQPNQVAPAPTGLGSDQVAPASGEQPAQAQDTSIPAKKAKVGVPAGKQAVDQAVATVQSVRSDRRPQVIQYAKQKVDALAGQAAKPAGPNQAEIDADRARIMGADNGGANESRMFKFSSKFLGMDI